MHHATNVSQMKYSSIIVEINCSPVLVFGFMFRSSQSRHSLGHIGISLLSYALLLTLSQTIIITRSCKNISLSSSGRKGITEMKDILKSKHCQALYLCA